MQNGLQPLAWKVQLGAAKPLKSEEIEEISMNGEEPRGLTEVTELLEAQVN